jgi:hypothetical protein
MTINKQIEMELEDLQIELFKLSEYVFLNEEQYNRINEINYLITKLEGLFSKAA